MKTSILALFLCAFGVSANAGLAVINGVAQTDTGSATDAYDFGSLSATTPEGLMVSVVGAPGTSFTEYANFVVDAESEVWGSANTYSLSLFGINLFNINNLMIAVWDDVHSSGEGASPLASFAGNDGDTPFGTLAPGQYHLDITGTLGPAAVGGQYSVVLSTVPAVPEPQTYALMLAGLAGVVFMGRRRRQPQ